MAVMLLIAVVLIRQKDLAARAAEEQAEQKELEARELQQFASTLLFSLEEAQNIEARQERVGLWVRTVFERSNCALSYDPVTGTLTSRGEAAFAAQLYKPGQTTLSTEAAEKLAACSEAFLTLAGCLSPSAPVRMQYCGDDEDESLAFREDIEALVLQGNTDRVRWHAKRIDGIKSNHLDQFSGAFVDNAELGAERARQALGHLLALIQHGSEHAEESAWEQEQLTPLHVFARRARVESPSFGQYQAGPFSEREGHCDSESHACAEARNLSLKLQFRRESLRKPFRKVSLAFCVEWWHEGSQLRRTLSAQSMRAEKLCAPLRADFCADLVRGDGSGTAKGLEQLVDTPQKRIWAKDFCQDVGGHRD